ncbi:MAG TPA: hypothetical protein PKM63_21380 [Panacibacter sp.]|nr:hypothetical protein [Panacibacter sp.]HNP46864.1 hypothetical protein [Panacibacter sp.]
MAKEVNYLDNYTFDNLGETMIRTFKILTGLIDSGGSSLTIHH